MGGLETIVSRYLSQPTHRNVNSLSVTILIGLVFCVVVMPRRWAIAGMIAGALYLTQAATFQLGGLTLFASRLLGVACFVRVLMRKELVLRSPSTLDRLVIFLYMFVSLVNLIGPHTRADTVARSADVLLYYFSFRGLITDASDVRWMLQLTVTLLVPFVLLLAIERLTRESPFRFVGAEINLWVRGEKVRCFGSFRHPALMGSLGATFFPLFVALFFDTKYRRLAIVGVLACFAIVGFSNSGGPLGALAAAIMGWILWTMRNNMRSFRWFAASALVVLALIMKAPIFYLLARLGSVTGGAGWHRAHLMDAAFQDFGKWWLIGMPVEDTRPWFPYYLVATGGADITNQFIVFGLAAGIGAVALAVWVFVAGFRAAGNAMIDARGTGDELDERLLWALGVALWVHAVTWLGISYFDQFAVFWGLHLAALAAVVHSTKVKSAREAENLWPGPDLAAHLQGQRAL